jgi:hypothetical protein
MKREKVKRFSGARHPEVNQWPSGGKGIGVRVRRGVFKKVEDDRRPPAGGQAVVRPQGIEG